MQTIIVKCFEVRSADGDGRGESHVAYFNSEAAANQLAAQSPGWMRVSPFEKTFHICETFGEYTIMKVGEIKTKALAKLTKEEREALGF